MKVCFKCNCEKPATREFFAIRNDNKKLRNTCRECKKKYLKEYSLMRKGKNIKSSKTYKKNKTNIELNLIVRVRGIVSKFMKKHLKLGVDCQNYGIEYEKIVEYLAPYPEDIENYHVYHTKTDITDFNNIEQIKLFWRPESFQLLKIPPKVTKGDRQKRKRERYKTDPQFNLKERLRARLRKALRLYSKTGKIAKSKDYGVDYDAIIRNLGACPGVLEEYHIDHIKPLVLFDLNDLEQIKLAFAPENHQWLRKEENLKKSSKYEEENEEEVDDR